MVKAILFDLDGTLADTLQALANNVNAVLAEAGLPVHPLEAYRRFVGNGAKLLMERAAGYHDDILLARFLERYDRTCLEDTPPYDGTIETLDRLIGQGIRLAVVTNKPHAQAVKLTRHLFGDRFNVILGSQPGYPRKPHPEAVLLAMQTLGVTAQECVFVGDSDVDVQTAHAAGMPCIGCCYGFRGEEELKKAGADALVYSFAELAKNRLLFA
ncbi:MAG: HAD family hydrolase [Ruminococcaceae bacterium]|nr:HAD family hydrolase [Oscillospiraceae bacterium]